MRFTIDRDTLLPVIARAASVSPSRGTIPILAHVMIEAAKGGAITLRATDLDQEITVKTRAAVSKPGSTTVSADKLLQITKNAAAGADIEFDLGERLSIKSGRSRFNLAILPVADFPSFAAIKPDVTFELSATELHATLSSVKSAAGIDEGRYVLRGTYLFSDGAKFGAVATDGKRLALHEKAADIAKFGVIIPGSTAAEIIALLGAEAMDVQATVSVSATKIGVSCGSVEITSKIIDGPYPDFRRVIPTATKHSIEVERDAMIGALRRASISADDRERSVRVRIADNMLSISSRGQEGDAADEIEVAYEDEEIVIGFNYAYMAEALSGFDGETVTMGIGDSASPLRIEDGGDLVYVVMPCRV